MNISKTEKREGRCSGPCLWSQHLGGRGRRRSLETSLRNIIKFLLSERVGMKREWKGREGGGITDEEGRGGGKRGGEAHEM